MKNDFHDMKNYFHAVKINNLALKIVCSPEIMTLTTGRYLSITMSNWQKGSVWWARCLVIGEMPNRGL